MNEASRIVISEQNTGGSEIERPADTIRQSSALSQQRACHVLEVRRQFEAISEACHEMRRMVEQLNAAGTNTAVEKHRIRGVKEERKSASP